MSDKPGASRTLGDTALPPSAAGRVNKRHCVCEIEPDRALTTVGHALITATQTRSTAASVAVLKDVAV